jgi:hypothetical protein
MINKKDFEDIQKKFKDNPSLIRTDPKFTLVYMISRMLDNIDTSINALNAILIGQNHPDRDQLKQAWEKFLNNAVWPNEYKANKN